MGANWSEPIKPSLNGDGVSWSTSHDWATVCIHVPVCATSWAQKKRRKSAWWNARSPTGSVIARRTTASRRYGVATWNASANLL